MKLLLVLLAISLHLCNARNFVLNTIEKCDLETPLSDTNLKICFKKIYDAIREENREGPGAKWGLLRLEPMRVEDFGFKRQEGSSNIAATFTDVLLHGVSSYTVTDIDARYKDRNATVTAFIPKVSAEGLYAMKGNIHSHPLKAYGEFIIELENIRITMDGKMVVNKDNPEFLGIADVVAKLQIGEVSTELSNFENDPIHGEIVHQLINSNDQILLNKLIPVMEVKISKMLGNVIDKVFYNVPEKLFYPEGI